MKNFYFILFLLSHFVALGQTEEDFYVVKFKETNLFFTNSFPDFYIDSVIDNRAIKSSYFGTVRKGLTGGKRLKAKFENDSINLQIKAIFKKCKAARKTKAPIIAVINFFEIGEFQSNIYQEEGFVYLDIDYFSKDSNNVLKRVGHFHGKESEYLSYDVTNSHAERICRVLATSLKTVKPLGKALDIQKANYTDTTYVPREGFYRSFLDYQYNTPIITQESYKITAEDFMKIYVIKVKSDSIVSNILGYSDGRNFYTNSEQGFWASSVYKIVYPRGRFLFMTDAMLEISSKEIAKKTITGSVTGIWGGMENAKNGNIIFDLATGKTILVNSYDFGEFLRLENQTVYEEYKSSKKREKNAKTAIQKINAFYHKGLDNK